MNALASFAFLIATAQSLADAVNVRDNVYLRPAMACKAVAGRLASGIALLRAFVRRLLILIALDMEWGLEDKRVAMKRPHGRKANGKACLNLKALDIPKASPWLSGDGPQFKKLAKSGNSHGCYPPMPVEMAKLYAQLDYLAGIAANPLATAGRLAFHLARKRAGIIMAPEGPKRIAGRWGTQVSASFDAMAANIVTKSRVRPPPLRPRRTHWPTITAL
jgi:hypothetical protein